MSYWDTSALAKLYLEEPDPATFRALADEVDSVTTSALSGFELRTTFGRQEAAGTLPNNGAVRLTEAWVVNLADGTVRLTQMEAGNLEREFDAVLAACFARRPPTFIRTNDALRLAAARAAGEDQFVTADARQAATARLLGFTVLP